MEVGLKKKYFLDFLTMKIVKIVVDLQKQLFDLLDEHGYELVKKIVICYCCIRLKHHASLENLKIKKFRMRTKLSEEILFRHL